ncbi:MAG: phage tail protein [Liquorilactobacillus sp.]|jgi:hypothetical protein|uniref:phage tail protein n=1 Tax=Liquorilactobacillus nagelii TaxID=82688 RepID=UPI0039E87BC9
MAIVGLKMITLGLVDENQSIIADATKGLSASGILQIDDKYLGSKTADISNLSGSTDKVYGNNKMQDLTVAKAEPTVALEINNLDFDIVQKLLGRISDSKGGYTPALTNAHVALLIESQTIDRKNSVYFGFGYGTLAQSTLKADTDTNKESRADDQFTYTALDTNAFDSMPYKTYYTGDSTFDEANMMKEVFGGYTATTGTATSQG